MRRQDLARYAALGVAGSRAALGVAMVAAPRPFALWLAGRDGRRTGMQLLARSTGGRDAALGTAAVVGLARGGDARLWTAAQLGSDMTDLVATVAMRDGLPRNGRRVMIGMAGAASAVLAAALVGLRGGSSSNGAAGASAEQTVPASRTADGMGSVVIAGESQDDPR
ncbi:MAG TPA: hypothetical protein VGO83_13745 [Thermoleophilaceae bacterium]|nr:hypothetical protein [Thermoleophilaceae bacterium]